VIDRRLLASAGVDPELPAARQAALLVQLMPLRRRGPTGPRDTATVLESRWFDGATECHRVLGQLFHGAAGRGAAFGAAWPYLEAGGRVAAPGLPVVVGADEEEGPDGCYRLVGRTVWREAGGEPRQVMALGSEPQELGRSFELLWFADRARYVVADGRLEVEDLFSTLRMVVPLDRLETWLARGMRVDGRVLEGLDLTAADQPPSIEVRRPAELVAGGRMPSPGELLGGRAGVASASRVGDEVAITTEDGRRLVFNVAEDRDGWRAFRWEGEFPYRDLSLRRDDRSVSLTATLDEGLDPLAPGVRTQVAFDLRSDLIALE
jgi:hypothetical protein